MWVYKCKLGLNQTTCNSWIVDKESRGYYKGIGGCPSCIYRIPASLETKREDRFFKNYKKVMKIFSK